MTIDEFRLAVADIDKHIEGAAIRLNIYLKSGRTLRDCLFGYIERFNAGPHVMIVISQADTPPIYVPPSSIEFVQLAS